MPRKPPRLGAAFVLLCLCRAGVSARGVDAGDHASFLRDGRLFRFDYANDFFAGRDRYYSQGYGFALFHPALARAPLMPLLIALPGGGSCGLSFRQSGFTPTSLFSQGIRRGDRPFASYLYLGHIRVSRDEERDLTLTSEIDAGLIGQGAGGKWIQTGLHRAFGNLLPLGWDNQIRNDAVLGYYGRLEKRAASAAMADAGVFIDATIGTLYTNAAAGVTGRFGALAEPRRLYLFGRLEEKLVGYDATLQGGVFNRGSPYALTAAELERAVLHGELGVVLDRGAFALVFSRSFQSREFKGGLSHQWGEVSVITRF